MHGLTPINLGSRVACRHNSGVVIFSFLIICTLTIVIELILHCLEHRSHGNKWQQLVLVKIYKELMLLGFISLCLVFLEALDLYEVFFHEELDHRVLLIFEYIHLVLFFLGLSYILVVSFLNVAFFVIAGLMSEKRRADMALSRWGYLLSIIFNKEHFKMVKARFCQIHHIKPTFRFTEYITLMFLHTLSELVELSLRLFITLWVIFMVCFGIDQLIEHRMTDGGIWIVLPFFYILMILSLVGAPVSICYFKTHYLEKLTHHIKEVRADLKSQSEAVGKKEKKKEEEQLYPKVDVEDVKVEEKGEEETKAESDDSLDEVLWRSDMAEEEHGHHDDHHDDHDDDHDDHGHHDSDTHSDEDAHHGRDEHHDHAHKEEHDSDSDEDDKKFCAGPWKLKNHYFMKRKWIAEYSIEILVSTLACYMTFLFTYVIPLIHREEVFGDNGYVQAFAIALLFVPFLVSLLLLCALLPDYSLLTHLESGTNMHMVRKVIRDSLKKVHKHNTIAVEKNYLKYLQRLEKAKKVHHKKHGHGGHHH